ncbi:MULTISPECIES: hypothetical protein [Pseudomonas]|uniref:ATP-dependent Clp protease proteolytic subunit n=2 Tax=Pseudomonas TaxID=286 RepID=A0A2X2CBV7_PSELU|nr:MULTISPECIES: hypothetical protein [Pseudomonas]SER22904.1 hypothetical protein SAMN05216409_11498 [Pseudomonas lutea]SPZ04978.1 Uncharacterised protein [Pseudomonas luteola]
MADHQLRLEKYVDFDNVNPIIGVLNNAVHGDQIEILIVANRGGAVDAAFDLVDAIRQTKASVKLRFSRYIISAAAYIWCWFFVRPESHVEAELPHKPGVVVYHRPRRILNDEHIVFLDELDPNHPYCALMKVIVDKFDELFDELLVVMGYSVANDQPIRFEDADFRHERYHMRTAYYANHDVTLPA